MVPLEHIPPEIYAILGFSLSFGLFFSKTLLELLTHLGEEERLSSLRRRRRI